MFTFFLHHIVIISIFFITASFAKADHNCRSEVSYSWKQIKEGANPTKVSWSSLEANGSDETSAKTNLNRLLVSEQAKASDACRTRHENLSGCISTKFSSMTSVMHSLGFTARKALEDAIGNDCKNIQGICSETSAGEPVCTALNPTAAGEATKEEGKEATKTEKKK